MNSFSPQYHYASFTWRGIPTASGRTLGNGQASLLGEAFPLRAAVLWVMDKLHRLQAAADLIGRRRRVALRRVIVAVADDDVTQGGGGWLRASKGVDAVPGLRAHLWGRGRAPW